MYIKCQTESIGRPCANYGFESSFIKAENSGRKWQKTFFSRLTDKVARKIKTGDFDMTEVVNSRLLLNVSNFSGYLFEWVLL